MRTRPLPLSHNKTLSCVTPASRAARIAKSSIGTDASSNLTWRPSRARCTAMAPVPHPRSSASKTCGRRDESPANWQSEVDAQSALGRLEVGGSKSSLALISFVRYAAEVAPFESQLSTRAYTERISNVQVGLWEAIIDPI